MSMLLTRPCVRRVVQSQLPRTLLQRSGVQRRRLSAAGSNGKHDPDHDKRSDSSSSSSNNSSSSSSSSNGANSSKKGNSSNGEPRIRDRHAVDAAAAERRAHQQALAQAQWATSWMMPWERAQMDGGARPLKLWERVYWRLFVVLGGVGFAYETWVLGNRRMWLGDSQNPSQGGGPHGGGGGVGVVGGGSGNAFVAQEEGATIGLAASTRERAWRERPHVAVVRQSEGWYRGRDVQSGRLLTDEELVEAAKRSTRWA